MITINLDTNSSTPLYEQIYQHIKQDILSGRLKTGEKLPSTRSLSAHLQVSRNTVDMAYSQLYSEGYVDALPQKGHFVSDLNTIYHTIESVEVASDTKPTTKPTSIATTLKQKRIEYDFSPYSIDSSHFPYSTWQKLMKKVFDEGNSLFLLGDNQGDYTFRLAIKHYLEGSRGVKCDVSQIIVGAGADYLLQLLSQLLKTTDTIAMEDPSYTHANHIFTSMHLNTVAIPVDSHGLHVEKLRQTTANIAYVTPSHQFPLGSVMSINRRLALLSWANECDNRYIIEDDHDSEFRYVGRPIPALQSLDSNEKVIYLGTFSRSIAPAIRVGYMVLPYPLYQGYQRSLSHYSSTVSRLDQRILTEFIEEGYFERHLNRMKKIYKQKHDTMLEVLQSFGSMVTIIGGNAGLHLVVQVNIDINETTFIDACSAKGINLYPLSPYYTKKTTNSKPAFLMGYANMDENDIRNGLHEFYQVMKQEQS